MGDFAPWSSAKATPSRPDSSSNDVRAAAVRSVTQRVNTGSPPQRRSSQGSPLRTFGSTVRRGSTATALVMGMADASEGWTPGTVPPHVDLILLSDEELASSPTMDRRSPGNRSSAIDTASLPAMSPSQASPGQALASRQSARSGGGLNATGQGPLPSLAATQQSLPVPPLARTGTLGLMSGSSGSGGLGRRSTEVLGAPPAPKGAATARRPGGKKSRRARAPPEPEKERFIVPRAIAQQIESLRQLAWTGGPVTSPVYSSQTPRARAPGNPPGPGDAAVSPRAGPTSVPSPTGGVPAGPPRVLPTVRLSPPRRDYSPGSSSPKRLAASRPLGFPVGVAPDPLQVASHQRDAMAWYRTEVAMLREQE